MQYANIAAELCLTTGLGDYSLFGPMKNARSFSDALIDGEKYGYRIGFKNGAAGHEIGVGTWDATTNTFSRDSIENSSNNDAIVNWTTGEKVIEITITAGILRSFEKHVDSSDASGIYSKLIGLINGVNTSFTVSSYVYKSGSLMVWYQGGLQSGNEVIETSPNTGIFDLSFAPATGNILMVRYATS